MSDAGDEIQVDAPVEVEVEAKEPPKGKMSVEDALKVWIGQVGRCALLTLDVASA